MKLFSKIKSGRGHFFIIGLMLAILWGSLLFQGFTATSTQTPEIGNQTAYQNVLPNFLAPVIRKEVHKETSSEEEETFAIQFAFPRLNFFSVWQ